MFLFFCLLNALCVSFKTKQLLKNAIPRSVLRQDSFEWQGVWEDKGRHPEQCFAHLIILILIIFFFTIIIIIFIPSLFGLLHGFYFNLQVLFFPLCFFLFPILFPIPQGWEEGEQTAVWCWDSCQVKPQQSFLAPNVEPERLSVFKEISYKHQSRLIAADHVCLFVCFSCWVCCVCFQNCVVWDLTCSMCSLLCCLSFWGAVLRLSFCCTVSRWLLIWLKLPVMRQIRPSLPYSWNHLSESIKNSTLYLISSGSKSPGDTRGDPFLPSSLSFLVLLGLAHRPVHELSPIYFVQRLAVTPAPNWNHSSSVSPDRVGLQSNCNL